MQQKRKTTSISTFFRNRAGQPPLSAFSGSLYAKIMQAVGSVMFACVTESPLSRIGSQVLHGFVDICGGRLHFANKIPLQNTCLIRIMLSAQY